MAGLVLPRQTAFTERDTWKCLNLQLPTESHQKSLSFLRSLALTIITPMHWRKSRSSLNRLSIEIEPQTCVISEA
jgi:hypothetical protein